MRIDVSYEALLQSLVQAIRDERDHGAAMMSLVSRLVDEGCQQDWFEAHWRTDARLRLAQMACGHMPKEWRSAVRVLEVIAEAARQGLKADEVDNELRATLLAIMRLADFQRSTRAAAELKAQPGARRARRRKANGAGSVRRGRRAAQLAKPATSPQAIAIAKTRTAATKTAAARKAKRSKPLSRAHTAAQLTKAPASRQAAAVAKGRPATAKTAATRKAKRSKPLSGAHTPAQLAKAPASRQAAAVANARPAMAKATKVRKAKRSSH